MRSSERRVLGAKRTSRRDQSRCGSSACSHSAEVRRRRPARTRAAPAHPGRWEPWPVKRKTGACRCVAAARGSGGGSAPWARAARAPSSSSRLSPTATARCSKQGLVVAREKATSVRSSSGFSLRWAARRSAAARRAGSGLGRERRARPGPRRGLGPGVLGSPLLCPLRALAAGACLQDHVGVGAADAEGGDPGAARALVRLPGARPRSSSSTSPASQSTLEEGASTCRVLGRTPSRIASTILITPATPAAAWVWPMLDLIEPSLSGASRSWP